MIIDWKPTTEDHYDEMLGMLPPAARAGHGFLVGEPMSHRLCNETAKTQPTFTAFTMISGGFYKAAQPLTIAEFLAVHGRGHMVTKRSAATGEQTDA